MKGHLLNSQQSCNPNRAHSLCCYLQSSSRGRTICSGQWPILTTVTKRWSAEKNKTIPGTESPVAYFQITVSRQGYSLSPPTTPATKRLMLSAEQGQLKRGQGRCTEEPCGFHQLSSTLLSQKGRDAIRAGARGLCPCGLYTHLSLGSGGDLQAFA